MAIMRGNEKLAARMDLASALVLVAAVFLALALALVPALTYAAEQAGGAALGEAEDLPAPEELQATSEPGSGEGESTSADDVAADPSDVGADSPADEAAAQQPVSGTQDEGSEAGETGANGHDAESGDDPDGQSKEAADPSRHYALRLIVDMGGAVPREEDAVLAERDGVYLIGFANEGAIAEAEQYYAQNAAWCQRDVVMGAAGEEGSGESQIEAPAGSPAAVNDEDNALALLGAAPAADSESAAAAEKPLVALIDTGAPADSAVVGSASLVGDDVTDYNGHATAMLEAMKAENPDVRVLAIKALDDDGHGSASSVYAAIEYAIDNGAQIINLSLAGSANEGNAAIAEAVQHALDSGIVVIAAAGNGGYDASYITPANIPGVFTVGACDEDGNVLESSNRGECVDGYVVASSTSFAASRTSGRVSLLKSGEGPTRAAVSAWGSFFADVATSGGASYTNNDVDSGFTASATYHITCGYGKGSEGEATSTSNAHQPLTTFNKKNQVITGLILYNRTQRTASDSYAYNNHLYSVPGDSLYTGNSNASARKQIGYFRTGSRADADIKQFVGVNTAFDGSGEWLIYNATHTTKSGEQLWANTDFVNGNYFTSDATIYAFWGDFFLNIKLDGNGADLGSEGTATLYELYGKGIYFDDGHTSPFQSGGTAIELPKRDKYRFDGYYTKKSGGVQYIDSSGNRTSSFTDTAFQHPSTATLYAHWTKIPDPFEIRLVDRSSSGGAPGSGAVYEVLGMGIYRDVNITLLMTLNANPVNIPTYDALCGLRFNGYWSSVDGGLTLNDRLINERGYRTSYFTDSYFSSDSAIYADWLGYDITLDDDGGSGGSGSVWEHYGTGLFLDDHCTAGQQMSGSANGVKQPTRSGYTFGGYYEQEGGQGNQLIDKNGYITGSFANTHCSPSEWAAAQNNTIYAYWIPNVYRVALDNQGADAATPGSDAVYERYGESVHLTWSDAGAASATAPMQGVNAASNAMAANANPIAVPAKAGKVFNGYFTQPNGGGAKRIDENGNIVSAAFAPTAYTDDTGILYAYWTDAPPTLPLTGGVGENRPLMWGSTIAVVGAAGVVFFRALRRPKKAMRGSASGFASRLRLGKPAARHAR